MEPREAQHAAQARDELPEGLAQRFREELRLVSVLLEQSFGAVVTYLESPDAGENLDEECDHCHARAQAQAQGEEVIGRKISRHVVHPVSIGGRQTGAVIMCYRGVTQNASPIVGELVRLALRNAELRENEAALLGELSASWESLEAVYEISSDMRARQSTKNILDKLTERAVAVHESMRAALWLAKDSRLEPTAMKNVVGLIGRERGAGLIDRSLRDGATVVYDGFRRGSQVDEFEEELQSAVSVVVVPVATKGEQVGALVVWQNERGVNFDTRVVRLVEALAHQAAMVIENERLHRESIENERLRQEVEIGSSIQQTLLVGETPNGIRGVEMAALAIPSQKIDGDFYDFIEHEDDCFDVVVGDVMGKGIPAALVGAATKNLFLRALIQLRRGDVEEQLPRPEEIVGWVNVEVTAKLISLDSFVTVCYARFDPKRRRLEFVDCGHTKTVHFIRSTGRCTTLEGNNMPVGFSEREIFKQRQVTFSPGDIFLFYSDGVTETRNPSGELFGEDRLSETLRRNSHLTPKELTARLREELASFSGAETFGDDLTCVVVRIGGAQRQDSQVSVKMHFPSELSALRRMRAFVTEMAAQLPRRPLDEMTTQRLALAVNEVAVNVIRHAHGKRSGESIELLTESYQDRLVVLISYRGEPFDPATAPPPTFDGSREGGFGLYIIANSVDDVAYVRDVDGRNVVALTVRIKD